MEEVLREIAKQPENRENAPMEEIGEENETKEMKGDVVDARVFFTNKGAKNFTKTLTKKGFVEERGLKEFCP